MIEGLQVDVSSDELKKIIQSRADYHSQKASLYEKKAAELRSSIANVEEDAEFGKVSGGRDIGSSMATQAKEHKDKVVYFKFMLEHVIQNDTYRLGQQDLALLGVASRHF